LKSTASILLASFRSAQAGSLKSTASILLASFQIRSSWKLEEYRKHPACEFSDPLKLEA